MTDHLRHDPETGHYFAAYSLCGRNYELDLTTYLQVGQWSETAEVNPDMLLRALSNCGPLRYTIFQAWCEARQAAEGLARQYEVWWNRRYADAEDLLQREKQAAVVSKCRSLGETITEARIKARVVNDNPDEYQRWQEASDAAKDRERRLDGLYRCIDVRGKELSTIITNLGFLNRQP